jgi:ketosteroid isomerase-like protein
MKRILFVGAALAAVVFAAGLSLAEEKKQSSDEKILAQLEQQWADALVKRDQAVIDRITAPDWMLTDPEGNLTTKAQADTDLKSGTVAFESFKTDELKVRVFGDTAVVHGLETEKSKYKDKDTSGQYRFTDTFVKREGRWQCVATHVTRVAKH